MADSDGRTFIFRLKSGEKEIVRGADHVLKTDLHYEVWSAHQLLLAAFRIADVLSWEEQSTTRQAG